MTTRSARRVGVVEIKPDAATALANGGQGRGSRAAGPVRRLDHEHGAVWAVELNQAERQMLVERLAPLTEREREVVFAVCAGGQNPVIADRLFIALPTLRTHLMRINQKLGLRSKSETIRFVLAALLERYREMSATGANGASAEAIMPDAALMAPGLEKREENAGQRATA